MRDLLDSTLDGWYSYLASWQAPGETSQDGCQTCAESSFSHIDGLGDWPHDIMHRLVRDLSTAARHVHYSLDELDESAESIVALYSEGERAARSAVLARHAEFLVLAAVETRKDEMRDVLEQCVAPALEEYLSAECERGLLELFAADGYDRPVY